MKEHYNEKAQGEPALYGAEAALYARLMTEPKPASTPAQDGAVKTAPLKPRA